MTHTIDPHDASAYDRFNSDERSDRDLPPLDRDALHTAVHSPQPMPLSERLMLLGIGICLVGVLLLLGMEHFWRPLLQWRW